MHNKRLFGYTYVHTNGTKHLCCAYAHTIYAPPFDLLLHVASTMIWQSHHHQIIRALTSSAGVTSHREDNKLSVQTVVTCINRQWYLVLTHTNTLKNLPMCLRPYSNQHTCIQVLATVSRASGHHHWNPVTGTEQRPSLLRFDHTH